MPPERQSEAASARARKTPCGAAAIGARLAELRLQWQNLEAESVAKGEGTGWDACGIYGRRADEITDLEDGLLAQLAQTDIASANGALVAAVALGHFWREALDHERGSLEGDAALRSAKQLEARLVAFTERTCGKTVEDLGLQGYAAPLRGLA